MRQKIKYVIKVVGEETEYLAYVRGDDESELYFYDNDKARDLFKCTPDTITYNQEYHPLVWREFNCPYILTVLETVRTIEVMEK